MEALPVEMKTLEASDGVMLSYLESGEGRPIVFIHGWAATSRFWEGIVSHLSPFRIIAPDLRGHGDSGKDSGIDYSTQRLVKDILELVDALGLVKPIIVGHSLGGIIAAECAANSGASGLMITGVPRKIDVPVNRLKILMKMRWVAERLVTPKMFAPGADPELLDFVRRESARSPAGVLVEVMESTAGSVLAPIEGKLPLLVVAGEFDSLNPLADQRLLAGEIGGEFRVVKGAGHNLMLEKPGEFAEIITDFTKNCNDFQS